MTGDRGSDPLGDLVTSILIVVTILIVVLVSAWWLFQ
jgi:hypothetical protein